VAGSGNDGSFDHALSIINNLRVSKRLPFGGSVEAAWITQATEQLRTVASDGYVQSSRLVLSGNVPLLRGAGEVAREDLIQAERNLVYQARTFEQFRRDFLIAIAQDFFDLLQARAEIANQEEAIENLRNIEREKQALLEAGRIAEFERNDAANQVLSGVASLASQRESYILRVERFKIRLGLSSRDPVELVDSSLDIPEPEVPLDRAVEFALNYRLDLQNERDRVDDARRALANARNNTMADLDVTANVGIPTDPRRNVGRLNFSPGDLNYQAGVTLGLPLDREAERLGVRAATITLQARERDYAQSRDEASVAVRQAVRNVDLARFQLTLAERAVEINQRRVRETELKRDEVTTRTRVDAATELQQSQNNRDRARTNLRNAVLRYLRESGQLRVAKDGTFLPLPGMEPRSADAGARSSGS
jgi:outer membrane protein TolC